MPPGCPERTVVKVLEPDNPRLKGHGVMLKLDCGHIQWLAGGKGPPSIIPGNSREWCLGGCYRHQRFMGNMYA